MATAQEIASAVTTALTASQVNSVSLKLPKFWAKDPSLWFAQVEKQFTSKNITTSQTKFDHVVAILEPSIASLVRPNILTPSATPYETLKTAILSRCRPSKEQRIRQVLQIESLGDRRPTELLADLQCQLDDINSGDFLKSLFLERLPSSVRMHLMVSNKTDLNELAALADELVDNVEQTMPSSMNVSETPLTATLSELQEEISAIRKDIKTKSGTTTVATTQEHCWYHRKFGKKANKCTGPPCQFPN